MKFKLLIILLLFLSCKNNDQIKIINQWKGIETRIGGITGEQYSYPIEIEFSEKNKAWEKGVNSNNGKVYTNVFEYQIKSDSIFFNKGEKNKQKGKIEIITDAKLIITAKNSYGQKVIYTLNKIK